MKLTLIKIKKNMLLDLSIYDIKKYDQIYLKVAGFNITFQRTVLFSFALFAPQDR